MKVGSLDTRIALESNTPAQDAYGEDVTSWGALDTVWAEKKDVSGGERFAGQQVDAQVTTVFTVRHRTDLTAGLRVVHNSVNYNVESVQDPTGSKEWVFLMCSRNVN